MMNFIIYRCEYENVPENLSRPPRHGPYTLRKEIMLLVCQLLVFSVPLLNVNLGLGLPLALTLSNSN